MLSPQAGALCLEAVKKAKEHSVTISFDLNYRNRLWTSWVEEKQQLLARLISYADICFGNPRDAASCLGYSVPGIDLLHCDYEGGGDSFAAGILHGYLTQMTPADSLEFGIAAAAIKHTIPGDTNDASEAEVLQLIQNQGTGRVQR